MPASPAAAATATRLKDYWGFAESQETVGISPQMFEELQSRLRELLANRPSGGIIFTTIQKFTPGEDEDHFPELSKRHNIVVICDEAHRSQYGFQASMPKLNKQLRQARTTSAANEPTALQAAEPQAEYGARDIRYGYAQHLRDGLPNATFVAFTGTPVSSQDRDTRAVFGDYVHIYDVEQAVRDGATVPIYYESRLARLEQDGWQVNYLAYRNEDGYALPERIRLEGRDLQVTLVIKDWQPRQLGR